MGQSAWAKQTKGASSIKNNMRQRNPCGDKGTTPTHHATHTHTPRPRRRARETREAWRGGGGVGGVGADRPIEMDSLAPLHQITNRHHASWPPPHPPTNPPTHPPTTRTHVHRACRRSPCAGRTPGGHTLCWPTGPSDPSRTCPWPWAFLPALWRLIGSARRSVVGRGGWVGGVGLGWIGLGWVGLGWLGWVGLGWVGLGGWLLLCVCVLVHPSTHPPTLSLPTQATTTTTTGLPL